MPLPKSASIAARATEVYAETWEAILHQYWDMPPHRDEETSELFRLLAYLRQLLTCCACAGLLEDAMISLSCGHCYCHDCQFRSPILKIQCRQCRERTGLVIENQLRIVVKCYRNMCLILADGMNQLEKPLATSVETMATSMETMATSTETMTTSMETMSDGNQKVSKGMPEEGEGRKPREISEFDPIPEILKEVQDGVKVSRAVLIVRPPAKYLKPPASTTVKKDVSKPSPLVSRSTVSSTASSVGAVSSELQESEADKPDISDLEGSPKPQPVKHKRIHRKKVTTSWTKHSHREPPTSSREGEMPQRREGRVRRPSMRADGAGTNSEEEIDVVGYLDSENRRTRFNITSVHQEDLEVSANCLDTEYIDTTSEDVKVNEDVPTMIPMEPSSLPRAGPSGCRISVFGIKNIRSRQGLVRPVKPKPRRQKPQQSESEDNPVPEMKTPKASVVSDTPTQSSEEDDSTLETMEAFPDFPIALLPLTSPLPPPQPATSSDTPAPPKKRRKRNHGDRPRCRCGTNNPQALERICARNKCPCFHLRLPCVNCLCRRCHNPITP